MTRSLGLGNPMGSAFGGSGVTKRLDAMADLGPLRGARLLDIGCANGTYTVELSKGFDQVDAIDIEPARLGDFRRSISGSPLAGKITIQQADAARTGYEDGTFDTVTAIEVMEHVPDVAETIAEMRRLLRPGGTIFITTPNRWFPFETHGVLIRGRRVSPAKVPFVTWVKPIHALVADARAFTRRDLHGALRRGGFRVLGSSYIFPPFDRSRLGQRIRPITDRLERTPLKVFGMAHVVCAERR